MRDAPLQVHISADGCAADNMALDYCNAGSSVSGAAADPGPGMSKLAGWLAPVCADKLVSRLADGFISTVAFLEGFDLSISRAQPPRHAAASSAMSAVD